MAETESRSWNRFNADFRIPESDEASRVALEVKASMDTWIQNNLSRLEAEMTQRLDGHLAELKNQITESQNALKSVDQKIAAIGAGLDDLVRNDPQLAQRITALQKQTEAARAAMQAAAEEWESRGAKALTTVMKIAGTVAKFA